MKEKVSFVLSILLSLFFLNSLFAEEQKEADELAELKLRIEGVGQLQDAMLKDSQTKQVKTFLSDRINLGGFITPSFSTIFGKDTETQTSFDDTHFDLLVSADIRDNLRAFANLLVEFESEFENQNAPWREFEGRETEFELANAWVEYRFKDYLKLQSGRFITPFGIINRDYFSPLLLQHRKPQGLRFLMGDNSFTLFELESTGLQISGDFAFANQKFGYNSYLSSVATNVNSVGGGGRLSWTLPGEIATLGVSDQTGKRADQRYNTVGADLLLKWKSFTVKNEFIKGFIDGADDQTSFYVQPSYSLLSNKFVLFGQVDYLDDTLGVTTVDDDQDEDTAAVADLIKKYEYTVGVNYLPWAILRARLEFTWNDYQGATATLGGENRDYFGVQASATVSF